MQISEQQSRDLLSMILADPAVSLQREGRKLDFFHTDRLMASLQPPESLVLTEDLELTPADLLLLVLIRTGQAAMALWEDGELVESQIIRKYMVRKSQGKSQIAYAKTRGKSRLGSRIRLQNAKAFFDEIHEKLLTWPVEDVDQILFYCPKILLPLFWEYPQPFERGDSRIVKVPYHIHPPTRAEVDRVMRLCRKGTLTITEGEAPWFGERFAKALPDISFREASE